MKNFMEKIRALMRGEEIEGEININIPFVLFVIVVIIIVAFKACNH